ncbi:hypothetical protein QUF58_07040 [Anaerolineales bacterium HSG24]|nr:hypothetical protein [Anaerolineales bacterium HSG24]
MTTSKKRTWSIDQLAKSEFFHQKLHEWRLIEVAQQIDQIKGETLNWDRTSLEISQQAWNKIIHRGVNYWFTVEEILENQGKRNEFFEILKL